MSVATYKIPRNLNEWVIFRQSVRSQFHYDNSRRTNAIFSVFLVLAVLGVILFGLSFYKRTRSNLKRLYTIDSQGYIHVQSHYTPLVAVLYGTRTWSYLSFWSLKHKHDELLKKRKKKPLIHSILVSFITVSCSLYDMHTIPHVTTFIFQQVSFFGELMIQIHFHRSSCDW